VVEPLVANIAAEWFHTGVNTRMCYKRRAIYISVIADLTAESLLSSVNASVTNKVGTPWKHLLTHFALKRPDRFCDI
jgi:hypothetical protein